jgi:apolipoprotein N-acyltransferase
VLQSHTSFQLTADAKQVGVLAARLNATVLVGVEQDVGRSRYFNEVVAWGPSGEIVASYRKNHHVPFGEYVPWRGLLGRFFDLADVPYDGIPGHGAAYISTPGGPLAVMISYEVFFDGRARSGVSAGGQLLVVPTNTASYRSTQVPTQELAADRIRAEETGRWLVQAAPTGYSTVVRADGSVVRRSTLDRAEVIYATVPLLRGDTIFDSVGDSPIWIVAVLSAIAVLGASRWSRRRGSMTGLGSDRLNGS